MALSIDKFRDHLTASGLLSAEDVSALLATFPEDKRPKDGEQLAKELVRQKKLTRYQVEQIYSGKGSALTFGNYVILDKLGQGGMGMVLKAQHKRMKRIVALKVMSAAGMKSPDAIKRFHREVEAAARLTHPHIVTAFDADEARGTHFLVMEYVEGMDLSALVKKNGPLPIAQAIACLLQAARGLEFAHEQGVIHRDIKPANLLFDNKGTVKILDMGLARIEEAVGSGAENAGLTSTGMIMGTVDFMSPEQAMDTKHADARSDIYSLGCTLFYLLTGKVLYEDDTLMKRLMAHQQRPIPSLSGVLQSSAEAQKPQNTTAPETGLSGLFGDTGSLSQINMETLTALDSVFRSMVAKKPEDRLQSMTDVIAALQRCTSYSSPTIRADKVAGSETNGSGGSSENELQQFLKQLSGDKRSTISTSPPRDSQKTKSVEAETLISSKSEIGTDPHTEHSLTLEQSERLRLSRAPASSEKTKSRTAILASIGAVLSLLLVVRFVMTRPTKEVQDNVVKDNSGSSNQGRIVNANSVRVNVSQTGITPYEILTSPDYEWTVPENLGSAVNTNQAEEYPVLTADGLRLIYHSFRKGGGSLCEATRSTINESFGTGEPLGPEFGNGSAGHGTALSGDGLVMVFGTSRLGGLGEPDLWQATRPTLASPFGKPVCLTALNSSARDWDPSLSPDGLTVLFRSNRPGGSLGACWISRRSSLAAEFEQPAPFALPRVTGATGYNHVAGAALSSDERVLIFSPKIDGVVGNDLYMSVRTTTQDSFGTPVNVGTANNSEAQDVQPNLSADGTILVFGSDCPGGLGNGDLWMTRRVRKAKGTAARSDGSLDVLSLVDVERDNLFPDGRWEWTNVGRTALKSSGKMAHLQIPLTLSDDYRLTLRVQKRGTMPEEGLVLGLRVAGYPSSMTLGYERDGKVHNGFEAPHVMHGERFPSDREFTLEVTVRGRTVEARLDEQTIFRFEGNPAELVGPGEKFWARRDSRQLSLGGAPDFWQINSFEYLSLVSQPPVGSTPSVAIAPFDAKQARAHQDAWARHLGTMVETTNSVGAKMILIPPGEFQMGSTPEEIANGLKIVDAANLPPEAFERSRITEEKPQHPVTITRPFCMSATEVTVGQFRRFVDGTKYWTQGEQFGAGNSNTWTVPKDVKPENVKITWRTPGYAATDEHPVTQVTWGDAIAFCNWLSEQELLEPCYESSGKLDWKLTQGANGYRLPTEAEWEYSCRAGTTTQFSYGDEAGQINEYGWSGESNVSNPQPVAGKRPNPFGLHDMHGNVREWCYDWYSSEFYAEPSPTDPIGSEFGTDRVMRGGRWNNHSVNARSAFRNDINPFLRNTQGGFRVVRAPLPSPTATDILVSLDEGWSSPENLGPAVNSKQSDAYPFVSADGLTLLFSSKRAQGQSGFDLWECKRSSVDEPFQTATNLPRVVNSFAADESPCLSADGLQLVFASNRPGSEGDLDLYLCRRSDPESKWSPPENLMSPINASGREDNPSFSPDGLTLYFASNRPNGQGATDIWSAHRDSRDASFGEPKNLGPLVNSKDDETHFRPTADGRAAILSRSESNARSSLWLVLQKTADGPFITIRPLNPIADEAASVKAPAISSDGRTLYFQSKRSGGQGDDDLWQVQRRPKSAGTTSTRTVEIK